MASLTSGRPLGFEAIVVGIQRVNLGNKSLFARLRLSNKKLTNNIEIRRLTSVRVFVIILEPRANDEECVFI